MCQICKKNITTIYRDVDKGHIDDFPWIEWAHKKKDHLNQILFYDFIHLTTQGLSDYVKCIQIVLIFGIIWLTYI